MPLFEYRCSSCNLVFESLASSKASAPSQPCRVCEQDAPVLEVSSFAFAMVGGSPSETSVDKWVGRNAEAGWNRIHQRAEERAKLRKATGETFVGLPPGSQRDLREAPTNKEFTVTTAEYKQKTAEANNASYAAMQKHRQEHFNQKNKIKVNGDG